MPKSEQITGYIGKDPVSLNVKSKDSIENIHHVYKRLYETIQIAEKACPNLKIILTDTTVYHNGGANAVQELAIALATAVHHIEELKKHGMESEDMSGKNGFSFFHRQQLLFGNGKIEGSESAVE